MVGGTAGGSHTHNGVAHTHSEPAHGHSSATSGTGSSSSSATPNLNEAALDSHTHSVSFGTSGVGTSDSVASGATSGTTYEPPFHTLLAVENNSGGEDMPLNLIAMYRGTLASIPVPWKLCDGTNSTPDLRDKFIKCANVGGDVGTTGGTAGHDHTDPSAHDHGAMNHTHSVSVGGASGAGFGSSGAATHASQGHTHPGGTSHPTATTLDGTVQTVDNNADTQPAFRTVAYVQFQAHRVSRVPAMIGA